MDGMPGAEGVVAEMAIVPLLMLSDICFALAGSICACLKTFEIVPLNHIPHGTAQVPGR